MTCKHPFDSLHVLKPPTTEAIAPDEASQQAITLKCSRCHSLLPLKWIEHLGNVVIQITTADGRIYATDHYPRYGK